MWYNRITMGSKKQLLLFLCFTCFLQKSDGQCQIGDNVLSNYEQQQMTIEDIFRGPIISSETTNIVAISSINYGGGLANSPSYLDITLVGSVFTVQTSSAFDQYEENETAMSIPVTITFACNGGTASILLLVINIDDTNNNYPEFIPRNEFEFVLAPPLPPGFLITGCLNEITVKDIDLTTSRIIFEIEENPYFQIDYDDVASNEAGPKLFKARLSTTTFIRTLQEPIALRITATDVDETGDPPLSVSGMIRISGDTEFEFPEEPVFSQTFYFATYTDQQDLILQDTISLQQGFDESVQFTLEGEYKSNFNAIPDGNQVSLIVTMPLPTDVLLEKQIYLIVRADREYTSGDTSTIVINLPEDTPLLFESALYEGSIIDDALQLAPLVLSQGFEGSTVYARIVGEYSSTFTATVQGNLVIVTMDTLSNCIIGDNSFLSIPVVASKDRSEATSIVTLEIVKDDNITPVFDESLYTGSYDPVNGLSLGEVTILQGYDNTVTVDLHGEHKDLFQINHIGTSIQLTSSTIPQELYEEQQITLSLKATKPRTVGAKAAIIIKLPAPRELAFEEPIYRGTIHNDELLWYQTILLSDGYDENVEITAKGEYVTYFRVTNEHNQVIITLSQALPESVITQNNNIALTLIASGLNAIPTTTSVLLDIIKEDATTPVLNQKIYQETYRGPTDFEIGNIFLTQGFDDNVKFKLDDSEHAQYFEISNEDNLATIKLRSAIPVDVIFNEKVLFFNLIAEKPLTVGSHAAVVIRFPEELTDPTDMRFSENSYVGALENNQITFAEDIILSTGYVVGTNLELFGDLKDYFGATLQGSTVNVAMLSPIPEQSIPDNRIIVLEIQASAPQSVTAHATLVVEYVDDVTPVVELIFTEPFYTGAYTDADGLTFTTPISLTEGYDEDVQFDLDGEGSQWFTLVGSGNSKELSLSSPIPAEVIQSNHQLVFFVKALRTGSTTTTATIVITLIDEIIEPSEIRFSEKFYVGALEQNEISFSNNIVIDTGYVIGTNVELFGDLKDYFGTTLQGSTVNVALLSPIPEQSIPDNRIIVLEIQASAPQSVTAHATLVVEYVDDVTPVVELIFTEPFYTGTYTDADGLTFTTPISLTEGYDEDVQFDLDGEGSQWFTLVGSGNSKELSLSSPIPAEVIQSNHQLVFVVTALRTGSTTTTATIVITLIDELIEPSEIRFSENVYVGALEQNEISFSKNIVIDTGYVIGTNVELFGDLKDYFGTTLQGSTVIVALLSPIPESSIPANRIIVLELQASAPLSTPAHATLVIEHIVVDDGSPVVELIFAEPFYTGTYTDADGLIFTTPISLTEGYDEDVRFELNGENSGWFVLDGTGNSQLLRLLTPIPAAVLVNNQHLVFVIEALRPGSTTTTSTIVISLTAEYTEGLVLGFDQITYRGALENNQLSTLTPIIMSEGYEPGVQVTLHGDLKDYFGTTLQGSTVIVALLSPIPESSIPANRIIVLEIQASAPLSTPAHATLVIEHIVVDDGSPVVELIFAEPFYTGTYTDADGLIFTTPISLTEGYDEDVRFELNGENSGWFVLDGTGNSQLLRLLTPIPAAVLVNNQHLVFVIEALRPGSTTTTSTIVISLTAEYTEGLVLGFDQITYRGALENNQLSTLTPIIMSEGYEPGVQVTLHGDLKDYFGTTLQGSTVIVALLSPIPESSIPANRIIVLEIQASAPLSTPAHATLVIEHIVVDDGSPVVELIFAEPFYTGTYTDADGLIFTTPISLTEGYDEDVRFELNGENSGWFVLDGTGNSQLLRLLTPIPAAVLVNNQQLVFVIEALRPGSTTTTSTIVISLTAEYTEGLVLGFDQITYRGALENNQLSTVTPIIISEGYEPGVQVTLHGDLKDYFGTTLQGSTVIVALLSPIPESSIPANRIIVLEIQASAPLSTPAHATLVIEHIVVDDGSPVVELIFAEPFYTGTYTDADGLIFTTPISLTEGYDEDVRFELNGENSGWFVLDGTGNSQLLRLLTPIPAAVLVNNQQLVFVIEALRPGSTTTTSTIIISLTAEYTEGLVLGFDQITYRGALENNQLSTLTPIIISEGYEPGVQVTLHGDLKDYFGTTLQGSTVIVALLSPIPESSIPANRIIVLEIQASAPLSTPAHATLVIEHIVVDDGSPVVELIFAEPFYTGTYTDADGLIFTTPISLTEGYDEDVRFELNGENSGWFVLDGTGNSQLLRLLTPIPAAVLVNNQQLVFVIEALRPGSTTTTSTIIISLTAEYTEGLVLGFDQITYRGALENNQLSTLTPIIISEGYEPGVQVTLHGDLKDYFGTTLQGSTVIVALLSPIPESSIPANRIIVLEIQASAPLSTPAHATLVIEHIVVDDGSPVVELIFAEPFYTGTYTDADGLIFTTPISLTEGYDEDVRFELNGENSGWFVLDGTGNSQLLRLLTPIPAAVLVNNQQLVFVIEALRPGSTTTTSTIIISLTAEYTEGLVLGFDQITYRGALENNQLSTLTPIIISEGYEPGVQVTLHGDLKDYFGTTLQGSTVIVALLSPIPESSIPANRIIVLEIQASAPLSTPAHATLVIEHIVVDDGSPVVELIFAEPFYTGTYTDADGLIFTTPISLTEGYDEDVRFELNGENSGWFVLDGTGNSQLLRLLTPIPAAVLVNNQQLVFVIEALRPGSTTTTSTIVISLTAEYTEGLVLGFDQITYRGALENNQLSTVTPIIISEGYEPGVQVTVHGDLKDYFGTTLQGSTVIVALLSPIPESSIPANRIIVLEIQASAPLSTPAHATLVIEHIVVDDGSPVVELIFAEPFYTGTYTDADGLIFTTPISLTEGYDEDVRFELNGENSGWFVLDGTGNSQLLRLLTPIPAAVLVNNQQLVFVIEALRPGSTTTTSTIIISLTAEYTEGLVLGFDQITYRGALENNQLSTLTPIIISEGYEPGVQVTLHGDLKDYFGTTLQGSTVIVALLSPIPESSIPANRIIVLEIQASAPLSTPAHATLVIEHIVVDDGSPVVELIFAEPFYTGTYTDADGLIFTTPISLTEGYDEDVRFELNGENSGWFVLDGTGNSQLLRLLTPIPAAVLVNNQQLVFVIEALRPGSTTTTSTIIISLTAEYTEGLVLGFDQITYRGALENNQLSTLTPIIISEGYEPGVQVTLHGDLKDYFGTTLQGSTVIVALLNPIPESSIPANRIIVLEIQASAPLSTPAHATLVIEHIVVDDGSPVVELIFAEPFYTGTYTDADGLIFTTPISLTEGYDEDVRFELNGENSGWFVLDGTGNSQLLRLLTPIPAAVLVNNQQLVFVIEALRPGSTTTTSTIVISLTAEYTEGLVLGFDQITYRGALENNQLSTLTPIIITEGYEPGVQVTLHGDLKDYFGTTLQGSTVIVALLSPIPESSIPANRIIVLEIQASAPLSTPAHATLVIEHIVVDDGSPVVELIFAEPFYTGTYTDADGLIFTTPISLTEGYDEDVRFELNGENSGWFVLDGTGNSQLLRLLTPIPAAVLVNNQQLVFVIEALRPGSTTTTSTIVISLTAEYTEGLVLGFDQITYRGALENNQLSTLTPIIISEGYEPGVQVTLHGDLKDYFGTTLQGSTVIVALLSPIPESSIPANRIIVLEIQASAPPSTPAHATLVIEHIVVDDGSPVVELIFAEPFYTGTYTDADGLIFTTPISLTEGYDEDVRFELNGENSGWFSLDGTGNSQLLSLLTPIPAAVLVNNQQLVFVIEALRPGSTTTTSTIVISLTAEYTEGLVLGFDQITYRGALENNQLSTVTPIIISEGYEPGVQVTLHGDLKDYFGTTLQGSTVIVALLSPIPESSIPANRIIVLEIQASAPPSTPAHATLVIEHIVVDDGSPVVELIFAEPFYTGTYTDADGLIFTTPISLTEGYDEDVRFELNGENSGWFVLDGTGNSQLLRLLTPIPAAVLVNNQQLVFVIEALRPGSTTTTSTIVINLLDAQKESFEKVLYEGVIQNGVVYHETIRTTEFYGTLVKLDGVHSSLFEAEYNENNGEVTVRAAGSLTLPAHITHIPLELKAGSAEAVLLLDISQSGVSTPVVVTFSSSSYAIRVENTVTGAVGQVQATADNEEAVRYSLQLNNVHLEERLSIDDDGTLRLSDPINSGIYTFQVVATTIYTAETGTATVFLTSEAIAVCGDDNVMPPLIVLDRDEEEDHYNLYSSNEGCHFRLTNRWPLDQTWVYVDETGLHTRAIDREHQSIAFMTLSQVQVEITLHCDTDETRVKRSLTYDSDPYDYGSNNWILVDTIPYNKLSRRSLVNLIVNDINDNAPIFVDKEREPIAVGYPVAGLEEIVLPRSLAELQATDADIGENAALVYSSSEPALAVSPTTGFVHIRDGAKLENNALLRVNATDLNGQGLTGSIDIIVKLLDESNILVMTVRDEFLNNEADVLTRISESLGYEIKVLRSVVISEDEIDEEATRKKRDIPSATGASLQLYVYGLIDREPVSVERLINDITNAEVAQVNIASTLSLEDHLAGQEICVILGRDTGLLAATIVLSVLLFIVLVLIAVWFFLRWRRNRNYGRFSDTDSFTSQNEPKPVEVVLAPNPKPRLNIEELKKSERRLQEMLDAPIEEVTVETTTSRKDAVVDIPPFAEPNSPIVIQSMDKLKAPSDDISEDEFGEIKIPKPKSVVTFNENVEKIIHVEDNDVAEASPSTGFEIYKL